MTPDEVHDVVFGRARFGRRGYDEREVDEFLDRVEATLRGVQSIDRSGVETMSFHRPVFGYRGYDDREVDAFMQRVVAEWPVSLREGGRAAP